jgi:hypothetical protein
MVEDGSNPLLEKAAASLQKKRERKQDKEKVAEILPGFQLQIADVITTHVPAPEEHVVDVTWDYIEQKMRHRMDTLRSRGNTFSTVLEMTVPVGGEDVTATVSSSGYPDVNDEDSKANLDYKIDVADFDHILRIKEGEAYLQSKERKHEPFTEHTPIGVPLPSWPAWTRDATSGDLDEYSQLLRAMNEDGTVVAASTPPRIVEDYTVMRQEVARINAPVMERARARQSDDEQQEGKSIVVHPRRRPRRSQ